MKYSGDSKSEGILKALSFVASRNKKMKLPRLGEKQEGCKSGRGEGGETNQFLIFIAHQSGKVLYVNSQREKI
jgi:hypothetical protein